MMKADTASWITNIFLVALIAADQLNSEQNPPSTGSDAEEPISIFFDNDNLRRLSPNSPQYALRASDLVLRHPSSYYDATADLENDLDGGDDGDFLSGASARFGINYDPDGDFGHFEIGDDHQHYAEASPRGITFRSLEDLPAQEQTDQQLPSNSIIPIEFNNRQWPSMNQLVYEQLEPKMRGESVDSPTFPREPPQSSDHPATNDNHEPVGMLNDMSQM